MTVSVVIPSYNSAAFVGEAVASALAQSHAPHEVIVVDDGSTDDTVDRLAPFAGRVRVIRQANAGVSAARNAGVAAAAGEWVGFLDADDVWHPDKLDRQLRAAAGSPAALFCSDTFPWPGAVPSLSPLPPAPVSVRLDDLVVKNSIVTSTVLVRRSALADAGEFDRSLQGPEDHDLWLRVARRHPAAALREPLTGYREVLGSLSRNAARMENGMRRILGKLEASGAFAGKPGLRRRAWAYHRYSCGFMYFQAGDRGRAAARLARSLAGYPSPLADVARRFGRVKLLAAALRPGGGGGG